MIRIISRQDIPSLLSMGECISLVEQCMCEVSRRNVELPLRWQLKAGGNGAMGMMPGYLGNPGSFGIKLVSLFPDNPRHGLSSHSGLMVLFEPKHGQPIAVMDAGYLTALRTAAASAVATRALAREGASRVTILGTGEQAKFHVDAMAELLPDMRLTVWGRSLEKANVFAAHSGKKLSSTTRVADSVREAIEDADIICCVTASKDPILKGEWLPEGCHVNAVGASFPDRREIDSVAVTRSRYFTDYRDSCLAQAGDFRRAMEDGLIEESHVAGEIGEVLLGERAGRTNADEITLYRSLGVAAQDLAAAHGILRKAESLSVGVVGDL